MPINTIPILSEDYPLFDWDDYPLSYYALAEGELVSGFQKETWNAIIDKALAALSATGMSWDTTYTTAANAKVTKAYGPLSAEMFNSVRHNLDCLTPVGWGWAKKPNMRGYIGRTDFNGYSKYGLSCDLFYAEYLLELVRRLNLTLSIMKGTANLNEMVAPVQSLSQSFHGLAIGKSSPMEFSEPSFSSFVCGIRSAKSGSMEYMDKAKSLHLATAADVRVKRMLGMQLAKSLSYGKQAAPFVKNLKDHSDLILSLSQAAMEIFNCQYLSSAYGMAETLVKTSLTVPEPYRLETQTNAAANISATAITVDPFAMDGDVISEAKTNATVKTPWCIQGKAQFLSKAKHSTVFDRNRPRRMSGTWLGRSSYLAYMDSAWYPPIWINGKLYIRQAYEANLNDATLEVI